MCTNKQKEHVLSITQLIDSLCFGVGFLVFAVNLANPTVHDEPYLVTDTASHWYNSSPLSYSFRSAIWSGLTYAVAVQAKDAGTPECVRNSTVRLEP